VGRPKDGDWRAGYVLFEPGAAGPQIQFIRVEYDVRKAAEGIRASTLPADFAEYLETGGKAVRA
jgi:hypothetical protein